jgi:hypothetical protein
MIIEYLGEFGSGETTFVRSDGTVDAGFCVCQDPDRMCAYGMTSAEERVAEV